MSGRWGDTATRPGFHYVPEAHYAIPCGASQSANSCAFRYQVIMGRLKVSFWFGHARVSRIRWGTSAALALVLGVAGMAIQSARAQTFTLLYGFTGKSDGGVPQGGVIRDERGNLYGTTSLGGFRDCHGSRCGVVFKVGPRNDKEAVLHSFKGPDGEFPSGSLLLDHAGNLYGTTPGGGTHGGSGDCHGAPCGVIFELDKTGKETVLYNFNGDANGFGPYAGLIRDQAGDLFGTTQFSGTLANGFGTVFELIP